MNESETEQLITLTTVAEKFNSLIIKSTLPVKMTTNRAGVTETAFTQTILDDLMFIYTKITLTVKM